MLGCGRYRPGRFPLISVAGGSTINRLATPLSRCTGALHVPAVEALMAPVVVAMANIVGRIELLTWIKVVLPHIPAGEVRLCHCWSDVDKAR